VRSFKAFSLPSLCSCCSCAGVRAWVLFWPFLCLQTTITDKTTARVPIVPTTAPMIAGVLIEGVSESDSLWSFLSVLEVDVDC